MSMITTRCPRTLRDIATGIETDPDSFKKLPDIPSTLTCPACGERHEWRPSQAWLALERPAYDAITSPRSPIAGGGPAPGQRESA